ncbi:MAG: putative endopeptidase [Bacteroidetes bacterium]|nr:MAG: putative endopeptidase [Bacteroidota bacterium]
MKNMLGKSLVVIGGISFLLAFKAGKEPVSKAIDVTNFDKTVRPQDDFFTYVNGNWIKKQEIPKSEGTWGVFNELDDKSKETIRAIVSDLASKPSLPQNSNEQRVGDFYASGMDTMAIERNGLSPLAAEFQTILDLQSSEGLAAVVAEQHRIQLPSVFAIFAMSDFKNSTMNVPYIFQSGTDLPEKDYYFNPAMANIRQQYKQHIEKMFLLMGDAEQTAKNNAAAVWKIEVALADSQMGAVEQRDPSRIYNPMSIDKIKSICPSFNWDNYFKGIGFQFEQVIVGQPAFLRQFNNLIKTTAITEWKAYFRWKLVHSTAGKLTKSIAEENFKFFGTQLGGVTEQQPRWKRVLNVTEGALGDAIGEQYVKRNFSSDAKKRVDVMVDNLIAAYEERIKTRDWMTDVTKKEALNKLHAIIRKLGYAEKWRSYDGLEIKRDSYVKNYLRSNRFDFAWIMSKANKPVDRMEWQMTPQTINAYYNPTINEIVFPAAIMQPPFFNPDADDAVNYGAMGAIIGHELTHGFDDQGSMFDAQGNLKNWWTDDDRKNFNAKTAMLSKQFSTYTAVDTFHVNGELTMGENIADLGGLTIAYYAFKRSLVGKPVPKKIDGFTAEQRFFIGWAQGWRNKANDKFMINMVKTNPHSPAQFRVLGPLSNMKEFYEAFDVKEGDKLYRKPQDRVEVW